MARPCKKRCVCRGLKPRKYSPIGPDCRKDPVALAADEMESLRLADFLGLYQDEAAKKMKVSRQTFARIVEKARKKTAAALLCGRPIHVCCGRENRD